MRSSLLDRPRDRSLLAAGILVSVILVVGVTLVLGIASFETQLYVATLAAVTALAVPLIRRAVRVEPTVTAGLLWAALILKVIGSGFRYLVLQYAYNGVGDANGYHSAGVHTYHLVRHFDFSFLQPPYVDTASIRYLTGFVYAIIGPSMSAGFLVFAMAALIGQWWFYRAFRVGFPNGDHRLYRWLIFFLPSLLFWPSSLGKDAIMLFGLGLATYGLARILNRLSIRAILAFAVGLTVVSFIRPPIGAIVVAAAGIAFVLRPSHTDSGMGRAVAWTFGVPVIILISTFMFLLAAKSLKLEGSLTQIQQYEFSKEGLNKGGSSFRPPSLSNPIDVAGSGLTALFRPFPWEISNPLVALAGLEGLFLVGLVVVRIRTIGRTLISWRNGMSIYTTVMVVLLTVVLVGFTNFGLLVRQRTSLLPFLLMLPTALASRPRGASETDSLPPLPEERRLGANV